MTTVVPELTPNPFLQHHLIVESEENFYRQLSTEVREAFEKRELEEFLYPVLSRILSTYSTTVTHSGPPSLTFAAQSQYPLGNRALRAGSRPKFTVDGVEFEMHAEIPDFARVFKKDGEDDGDKRHILVDLFEVKPLDTLTDWNTPAAKAAAEIAISEHLPQVYAQAMNGFILHPSCLHVYSILVIGVYYTQLVWTRKPGKEVRPVVHYDFPSPITGHLESMLAEVNAAIIECQERLIPEILCWNESIFHFHSEDGEKAKAQTAKVTLTKKFLWSLRQPLIKHCDTKYQRSWLSAPVEIPSRIGKIDRRNASKRLQHGLVKAPLMKLLEHRETLEQFSPSESASTASQRKREKRSHGEDLSYVPSDISSSSNLSSLAASILTRVQEQEMVVDKDALDAFLSACMASSQKVSDSASMGDEDELPVDA